MNGLNFVRTMALISAGFLAGALAPLNGDAQPPAESSLSGEPIRIVMGGYGPSSTSFSQALKIIGDRLEAKFGDDVEIRYLYNVSVLG